MKHISKIKSSDWNLYRKELDYFVSKKISFIQKFLEKNYSIKEDKNFYYKIFFLPLSIHFFNKKFPIKQIKKKENYKIIKYLNFSNYLKHLRSLRVHIFKDSKIKLSKNVSINFFHRHSEFKQICSKIISEINSKNFEKKISFKSLFINLQLKYFSDLKKNNVLFLKRRLVILILNYKFLKEKSSRVKNILISNHGIMGNEDQILLGCLSKKAKIFSLQSGYLHFKAKYHDQDDYLDKISHKILCWGKEINRNSKYYTFGSLYSHKNKLINNRESVIILPSVPLRNNRIPISSYFSHTKNEFTDLIIKKIIQEIRKINMKDKNCLLQCKDCDYEYYKKYFEKFNIKNKLVFSKINEELFGKVYKKTYIFYFSTSIIENYFTKSKIKLCINSAWIDFNKNYKNILSSINNNRFIKKNEKFIEDSCKKINLKIAKNKLTKFLK